MPDEMNAIKNLPDISFIDNKTIDQVRQEMVADYESFISEATGQTVTLERSSVHRMELYAAAAQIYQAMQYIDRQGKQNILKYSYSDFLDNLAIFKGVTRNPATAATTTLRFTLSAERDTATGIPQGTRVSTRRGPSTSPRTCTRRSRRDPPPWTCQPPVRWRAQTETGSPSGNCPPSWTRSPTWPA